MKSGLQLKNFTIENMPARLKTEGDLFKGVLGKGIQIEKAVKKIESMFGEVLNSY